MSFRSGFLLSNNKDELGPLRDERSRNAKIGLPDWNRPPVSPNGWFTSKPTALPSIIHSSTKLDTVDNASTASSLTNLLDYPNKTMAVPKAALNALYGQDLRTVITKDLYVTWHQGPPHKLQWTSIFCCPLTAQLFPSATYGNRMFYSVQNDTVWYTKKSYAEHGAAACAYDYHKKDIAYAARLSHGPPVGPVPWPIVSAPDIVQQAIRQLQQEIQNATRPCSLPGKRVEVDDDEEAAWFKKPHYFM